MKDLDYLHDVIFDAIGETLEDDKLLEELKNLPMGIKHMISEWGLSDTVARDLIYDHYKRNGVYVSKCVT